MRTCSKVESKKVKVKNSVKTVDIIVWIFFLCLLLVEAGCESMPAKADNGSDISVYARYAPVKVDILPLTEFAIADDDENGSEINVYVSVLDSFGHQGKSPGTFRFELYRKLQRSAEPKGKRIVIWPDIDLTEPVKNNNHWRDFLRAYEFNLDFEPQSNHSYILQVTYLCPNGRRLSAEFDLKHTR